MISNWTVKTKQIKNKKQGFINHSNYLHDKERFCHRNTKVVVLNSACEKILKEHDKRTEYRRVNSLRGGGVTNYATSFVLSLPRSIKQPTQDEWRKISLFAIKKIAEENDIPYEKLKSLSHIVLHDESLSYDKNTHVHILISNVINEAVCKGITQKKSTYAVKRSFNFSVRKIIGVDNNSYVPISAGKPDKPLHIARLEKAEKTLKAFSSLSNTLTEWVDSLKSTNTKLKRYFTAKKVSKRIAEFESLVNEKHTSQIDEAFDIVLSMESTAEDYRKEIGSTKSLEFSIGNKTKRKRRRRIKK